MDLSTIIVVAVVVVGVFISEGLCRVIQKPNVCKTLRKKIYRNGWERKNDHKTIVAVFQFRPVLNKIAVNSAF